MNPITQEINKLITTLANERGVVLTVETHNFLAERLETFITRGAKKFINGVVEHGESFLTDVDMLAEIQMEVMDLWMYAGGAIHKQNKFDARVNLALGQSDIL